jgi:3-deoxy-D-manno-octulosonate 8-phosphate phosphatase (KDO 8-P phosphatase)
MTACQGGQHAVREICELLTGLNGNYETTIENRIRFSGDYSSYLGERNKINTITELHR